MAHWPIPTYVVQNGFPGVLFTSGSLFLMVLAVIAGVPADSFDLFLRHTEKYGNVQDKGKVF